MASNMLWMLSLKGKAFSDRAKHAQIRAGFDCNIGFGFREMHSRYMTYYFPDFQSTYKTVQTIMKIPQGLHLI